MKTDMMTKAEIYFLRAYTYACRNGYKGSLADYVTLQYETYCRVCESNGIEPKARINWEDAFPSRYKNGSV